MENLLGIILEILAENGETRTLTLLRLADQKNRLPMGEPMVFDHFIRDKKRFMLPFLHEESVQKMKIDWGDGDKIEVTKELSTTFPMHDYTLSGTYRIKLYNLTGSKIYIGEYGSCMILKSIYSSVYKGWADDIENFISIGRINLAELSYMFHDTSFRGIIGPNWDTSRITSLNNMFGSNDVFNRSFGLNWDTGKVKSMRGMFSNATRFNKTFGLLRGWDLSGIKTMKGMFYLSHSFSKEKINAIKDIINNKSFDISGEFNIMDW